MKTLIRLLVVATVAALASIGAFVAPAQAYPAGCVGTSFAGTLGAGKAICNGNYLVRMQTNGDLVMRQISTGHVMWRTATYASDGAVARFHDGDWFNSPSVTVESPSQGVLTTIWGSNGIGEYDTNASVNSNGTFWIGYKRIN